MSHKAVISLEDLHLCDSGERILQLFEKLGYQVEKELESLDPELFFDTPSSFIQKIDKIYLIANHDQISQVFLFNIKDLSTDVLHSIARKILERAGNYLLIFTIDYSKIVFINPRRILKEKKRIKIYKLIIDRSHPTRHDIDILNALITNGKSPDQIYEAQCEAFDINKITNRFYQEYQNFFKKVQNTIKESNPHIKEFENHTFLHEFAQRLMGRVMFLYFIQKKGWLANDFNFLKNNYLLTVRNQRSNYYNDFLEPLFFEIFCKERKNDESDWGNIPFLNGGLFERDYYFEFTLPNSFFDPNSDDGLLGFFGNYNFTIEENTPVDTDVALDPEMLGKIFENLLEEEERKKSGTYYTPRPIVHFICKSILIKYLYEKINLSNELLLNIFDEENLDNFFEIKENITPQQAEQIEKYLLNVKILDPAVGSGAFLIAMLQNLMIGRQNCRKILGETINKGTIAYTQWKLEFIKNCLYGVDIKYEAIEIAKLRFWLSLIVDTERKHVQPLPNLDYNLMVGDSLIEEMEGEGFLSISDIKKQKKLITLEFEKQFKDLMMRLNQKKKEYFNALINEHPKIREEILEIEKSILTFNLQNQENVFKNELENLKMKLKKKEEFLENQKIIVQKPLFKDDKKVKQKKIPFKSKIKNDIKLLKNQINLIESGLEDNRKKTEKFLSKGYRDFFSYGLHFGDVFQSNGGFDIVIGNPPYGIKVENDLQENYGLETKDSYGVFIVRGLQLLREGGYLSFITSNTWQTIRTYKPLRQSLLDNTLICYILSMPGWIFGATVNTSIFLIKYLPNSESSLIRDENMINVADLTRIPNQDTESLDLILNNWIINWNSENLDSLPIIIENCNLKKQILSARYSYKQNFIKTYSNLTFFIASPNLYKLMNDKNVNVSQKLIGTIQKDTFLIKNIDFNVSNLEIIRFGDIAEIKQGLATGDNKYYLRKRNENIYGPYDLVDLDLVLTDEQINSLTDGEIKNGINPEKFGGHYFLPYDKGGESYTSEGWLPNYYVPTAYFIDWSLDAVNRLNSLTLAEKIRLYGQKKEIKPKYETKLASRFQNSKYYLLKGITFSRTGYYSPTFRLRQGAAFDTEGSCIFCKMFTIEFLLGVLCSKLIKYLLKNFIDDTVHSQLGDLIEIPFILPSNEVIQRIKKLVNLIIKKQKENLDYPYFLHEQKKIDKIIYEAYNLNQDDIEQIESWYERRYPILVESQKSWGGV